MFDQGYYKRGGFLIGSDEVGRGCLAGPLVCCSALVGQDGDTLNILKALEKVGIKDSKRISPKGLKLIVSSLFEDKLESIIQGAIISRSCNRYYLIDSSVGLKCCLAVISPSFIDRKNILNASLFGMRRSGEKLLSGKGSHSGVWLVDGNKVWAGKKPERLQVIPVISGDSKSLLIGAASVVAKVFRDSLMVRLSAKYPNYAFEAHYGYPTQKHRLALKNFGPSPIHRYTFQGVTSLK